MLRRLLLLILSVLAGLSFCAVLATATIVSRSSRPYRFDSSSQLPVNRVAIVFGALVQANGQLSPILEDRVQTAVQLYQTGKVQKLLMSGDNGRASYDEVTAMKNRAVSFGVPAADITLDYAGFDTYDSCYRAKAIFGLQAATLVTQSYHQPRAIYTCRTLGIDAVGVNIPDFERYPDLRLKYSLREYLADLKAWIALHITHRAPTFLGKQEPIS